MNDMDKQQQIIKKCFIKFLKENKAFIKYKDNLIKENSRHMNYKDYFLTHLRNKNLPSLLYAFGWNKTPQGFYFWQELNKLWCKQYDKLEKENIIIKL